MTDDRLKKVRETMENPEDVDMPEGLQAPDPEQDDPSAQPPAGQDTGEPPPEAAAAHFPLNDIGNGRRFVAYYGTDVLRVPRVGWFVWNGHVWKKDDDELAVRKLAQKVSERMEREIAWLRLSDRKQAMVDRYEDLKAAYDRITNIETSERSSEQKSELRATANLLAEIDEIRAAFNKSRDRHWTFAKSTGNSAKIDAMLKEGGVAISHHVDELDADPLRVNTLAGTLRFTCDRSVIEDGGTPVATVSLDPHDRADLISKCMPVIFDPAATAPGFDKFLSRIQPKAEMRDFLKRSFGLAMTGILTQHMWFFWGHGANGKSVLVDLIARILGNYSATAKIESLTGKSKRGGGDATPDLVPLMGATMVRASEPEQGEQLKEGTVKELTGGEPMLIRALHSDFVEVLPKFKLFLSGNYKPDIRGTDDGIWRRVLLCPFEEQIPEPERDPLLGMKLWQEAPGILNWLVEGLLEYLEGGLQVPAEVVSATKSYREESDPVGAFLTNCCEVTGDESTFTQTKDLVAAFNWWMVDEGGSAWRERSVQLRLKDKAERWRDPRSGLTFAASKRSVSGYQGLRFTDIFVRRWDDGRRGSSQTTASSLAAPDPDF